MTPERELLKTIEALLAEKDELLDDIEALQAKLDIATKALEFYLEWENKTENAWSKNYQRTVLSVDYQGPSKAKEALAKIKGVK